MKLGAMNCKEVCPPESWLNVEEILMYVTWCTPSKVISWPGCRHGAVDVTAEVVLSIKQLTEAQLLILLKLLKPNQLYVLWPYVLSCYIQPIEPIASESVASIPIFGHAIKYEHIWHPIRNNTLIKYHNIIYLLLYYYYLYNYIIFHIIYF